MDHIDFVARHRAGFRAATDAPGTQAGHIAVEIDARANDCLYCAPGYHLDFELPPGDVYIALEFAIAPEAWGRQELGATTFFAQVDGHARGEIRIDPMRSAEDRTWHTLAWLESGERRARVLRLFTQGDGGSHACAWGVWAGCALLLDGRVGGMAEAAGDDALRAHLAEREIERLRASPQRKLNLGAGGFPLEGWINVDGGDGRYYSAPADPRIVKLDVFAAFAQLSAASMDFISSEQFFEHFTRADGLALLRECHRVLAPGGVLRIQVPDLEMVVKLYRNELPFADWDTMQLPHRMHHVNTTTDPYGRLAPGERFMPAMMINNGFHMDGHRFLYDFATLAQSMRLAGFTRFERVAFGESNHFELRGIDRHDGGATGAAWVPKVALCVEATR